MCDLFSWIEGKDGRIYYHTDEDIEIAGMSFVDGIGHSAIEEIWKVEGDHKESLVKVPKELAEAVNRGKCAKMAKAGGAAGVHYDVKAGDSYGEIDAPWWPKALIEEAKTLKYFDNHAEPLPEWRMFETRAAADIVRGVSWAPAWNASWAAAVSAAASDASYGYVSDAAWDAARDAARAAASDASYGSASDAAWDAARAAARAAARNAARAAAWEAARVAAYEAASDAALLASCLVAFYGKKKNKHLTYAKKRWEVWQRGYGCLCDVDGVLYCYKRP